MKQRVRFSKQGKVRFLSHRDVARVWERGLRRSDIRVAYSEGFSPRPRISFGLALSTGFESLGEYLDIDLSVDLDPAELPGLVNASLPDGILAQAARPLPPGADSLQQSVTSSSWRIEVNGADPARIAEAVERTLALDEVSIAVERKGKPTQIDARPAIVALAADAATLHAELATQPRSLRPAELLGALDPNWTLGEVMRTHQWTMVDGARCEPIPLGDLGAGGATSAPQARALAS